MVTAIPIPPNPTGKRFTKGQAVKPATDAPKWLIDKMGGRAATIQIDYGYDLSYDVRVQGLGWYVKAFAAWLEPDNQPRPTDPAQGRGATGQVWTEDGKWAAFESQPQEDT